jgi:AAA domain
MAGIPRKLLSAATPQKKAAASTPKTDFTQLGGYLNQASNVARKDSPRAIILLGDTGIGKTQFMSQFPSPVFIFDRLEQGIVELTAAGVAHGSTWLPPFDDWLHLLAMLEDLRVEAHDWKSVCIETLGSLQEACFRYCCNNDYGGDYSKEGFFSYFQGPAAAAQAYWPLLLTALQALREERGMHVLISAHTERKPVENLNGPNYTSEVAYADQRIWKPTAKWAELIAVMAFQVDVIMKTRKGKESEALLEKGKVSDGKRVIHLDRTGPYGGKNRMNVSEMVECGSSSEEAYQSFCEVCKLDPATAYFR